MLLEQLSNAIAVSGEETAVRKIILEAIKAHVTDIQIDSIGNLTAFKKGTGASKLRVMLAAHMDEVGFMITGFENNGTLRFTNVGGIDDRILPALRVKIGKDNVAGVIMWTPIHKNKDQNVKAMKDLRIDIGAANKSAAEGKVKRGDRVAFDSTYAELSETMVRGKALDDRVGCSILVDILQAGPYPVDIVAAFTVQEEIGLRGAKIAAQVLQPDIAIALESAPCHDLPNPLGDPDSPQVANPVAKIGNGPVLTIMDRSMITAPQLFRFIRKTADEAQIPYQFKSAPGGGTDAGIIHVSNAGIPAAVISTPCRYIHGPMAVMSKEDYKHNLALVKAILNTIKPEDTLAP